MSNSFNEVTRDWPVNISLYYRPNNFVYIVPDEYNLKNVIFAQQHSLTSSTFMLKKYCKNIN